MESSRKASMFQALCEILRREDIEFVILSGYRGFPESIESDVDFMVSEDDFKRLPDLFSRVRLADAALIQAMQHEISATYYVFAYSDNGRVHYLHPDACSDFRRNGRLWLRPTEVLGGRRPHPGGWWIPMPVHEFTYYMVKRIDKGVLERKHLEVLQECFGLDNDGGRRELSRLFGEELAAEISSAIASADLEWFLPRMDLLRSLLHCSRGLESPVTKIRKNYEEVRRWWTRATQPTGLVVAVLGPDGSGKTTIVENLERELLPAFRRVERFHLRPRFGRAARVSHAVMNPHASPPRGAFLTGLKLALFAFDYWMSWPLLWVKRARSSLIIFDRYALDIRVDPARYRIRTTSSLLGVIRWLAPRPDLTLVLTARASTLLERKNELTAATAEALSQGYRQAANSKVPGVHLVDTDRSLPETLAEVQNIILVELHRRALQRLARK